MALLVNVTLLVYWVNDMAREFSWLTLVCNLTAMLGTGIALASLILRRRTALVEREIERLEIEYFRRESEHWYRDMLASVLEHQERPDRP